MGKISLIAVLFASVAPAIYTMSQITQGIV